MKIYKITPVFILLLFFSIIVTSSFGDSITWSSFRGNAKRTGNIDRKAGPKSSQLLWVFNNSDIKSDFFSSPAVLKERVYIGCSVSGVFSSSGIMYCIDANSGDVIWEKKTDKPIFSSPIVIDNKVYIGEGLHWDIESKLYCFNSFSGELVWSFQTESHVESSPTFIDGKIYFGAGDDGVFCLNANTGEKIWHFTGEHVDSSPIADDDSVYFGTGYGNNRIYCLDRQTGEKKWVIELDYPAWGSPSIDDGKIYVGIGNGNFLESDKEPGGAVICINAQSSDIIWRYKTEDSVITSTAVYKNLKHSYTSIYFGSRDGNFYCLDAKNGNIRWKRDFGISILSSPAIAQNGVYFGCDDGQIYCLDLDDSSIKWSFDTFQYTGGCRIISSPAIANENLYIGSCSQYIFCIGINRYTNSPSNIKER